MNKKNKYLPVVFLAIMTLLALIYLYPLFLVIINSFKTYAEVSISVISWPKEPTFNNFINAWSIMEYPRLFLNTLVVTCLGTAGVVLLGSLAGYKLSRTKTVYSWIFFMVLIAPMMIPFHSFMISLVKVARTAGLMRKPWGLGIMYWGLGAPLATFLYHGFVKTVPIDLDDCALMDGASPFRAFLSIIFPLMQPVTVSVIIINVMWMWNDFLLPLLVLGGSKTNYTLQLAANSFMGQYKTEWNYAMAGVLLTVIPAIALYLALQKHIIKGMVAGAVKM
ncbi:MAG: carbohydrate ABC transporter permease [Treponema sp.]|nr:carbohydrate ABC transporter permease [Treponema sp.]MCL2129792.1 carbohydrate ABC transporter permease [Treponema sp.]